MRARKSSNSAALAAAQSHHILGGSVATIADVFADPHFAARDMVVPVPHPGIDETMRVAGVAIKMSDTPGRVRHRAPLLGEHTDQYLSALGLGGADDDAVVERLELHLVGLLGGFGPQVRCRWFGWPRRARGADLALPGGEC